MSRIQQEDADPQHFEQNDEESRHIKANYELRPRDVIKPPKRYEANLLEIDVPQTYEEAMKSPDAGQWTDTIKEELDVLEKNNTWVLVSLPPVKNPISSNIGEDEEIKVPYREAVGSLMFASIVSRPDIMYGVGNVSRYLANYGPSHWNTVKRILKYLKDTSSYGIEFTRSENPPLLIGFSDSDFANDLETRHSTTGYLFQLSNGPITWACQRQQTVSLSTTEAEYIAASTVSKEVIWLRHLLLDIGETVGEATVLAVDNQSAMRLVRNPEFHKRTKHIDIRYHFIREKYENNEIDIKHVPSEDQLADILTKPLPRDHFQTLRGAIGMTRLGS